MGIKVRSFAAGLRAGGSNAIIARCLRRCFPSQYGLDVSVVAFLCLKDGTAGLGRAQSPFHIVAIFATFGQSFTGANGLEVKAVNQFLRRANLNRGKDYLVEAGGNRANAITPGRDASAETA